MIIDLHYHWFHISVDEAVVRQNTDRFLRTYFARLPIDKSFEQLVQEELDLIHDPDGEKLLRRMEKNGIDVTVLLALDRLEKGWGDEYVMEINQVCATLAQRHPKKFVALAGIHPRRPNAPELLRRCFEDLGMKGVKLHPDLPFCFYPNGEEAQALLKVAEEHNGIVVTHSGVTSGRTRNKFGHPLFLDDLNVDFPKLKVICAHMGKAWYRDFCAIARFKENLWGDLSGWQIDAADNYALFCRQLREAIDLVGVNHILFATDSPAFEPFVSTEWWIQTIKDLPRKSIRGVEFTEDEITAILGQNAKKLLEL